VENVIIMIGHRMELLVGVLGILITVLGGSLGWFSKAVISLTNTLADVDKKLALLVQSEETMAVDITNNTRVIAEHETRLSHLEGEHHARRCK